jgi:uncharacterized phage protein (TIGR01671 family)
MREIKFRGKRIDNGKFVEGDLIHGVNHKLGKTYILPIRGGVMALGHGLDPMDGYEVIPESVGQYTELKDQHEKEIYEGDVFKYLLPDVESDGKEETFTEYTEEVIFEYGSFSLEVMPLGAANEIGEVIGNIFDNPELINK